MKKNLKKEACVRYLSAALLPRVCLWRPNYFVERALLVTWADGARMLMQLAKLPRHSDTRIDGLFLLVRSALGAKEKSVGAETFLQDFSALGYRPGLPTARI